MSTGRSLAAPAELPLAPYSANDEAFQGSASLALGSPLCDAARQVQLCCRAASGLCDGGAMQDRVELTVAATIEPMAYAFTGRGLDRSHACISGELGLVVEALTWAKQSRERTSAKEIDPADRSERR